jgi:hypothetical protein
MSWAALGGLVARFVLGTRMATFAPGTFGMALPAFAYLFAHQAEQVGADVGHAEHWLVSAGLVAIALRWALRVTVGRSA